MQKVAIIGAGISGLSAAITLKKNNVEFKVFEISNSPGGAFNTIEKFNCLMESGPNSINNNDEELIDLINSLSIEKKVTYANRYSKNRFVVKDKKILALPNSLLKFIFSSILSYKSKINIFKELFNYSKTSHNETVFDFFERRFGTEINDYFVNPFVSGIYGGDSSKLLMKTAFPKLIEFENNYNSVLRGFIATKKRKKNKIITFKDGIGYLPKKMAETIQENIAYNYKLKKIEKINHNNWLIDDEIFTEIIFTQPSYNFKEIKTSFDLSFLDKIYYSPITTVNLIFDIGDIKNPLKGYGVLIPDCEHFFSLGVLFPSIIFSERCPKDKILLTVFIGGAIHPERAFLEREKLLKFIMNDLKKLFRVNKNPLNSFIKVWKNGIPQYDLNAKNALKKLKLIEENFPGIYFAGNYKSGISIVNSIKYSKSIALSIINKNK